MMEAIIWLVLVVVFLVAEALTVSMVSLWFAAGAVVVSDVAPNTVVAGCPARVIKVKDEKTAAKTALVDALRQL